MAQWNQSSSLKGSHTPQDLPVILQWDSPTSFRVLPPQGLGWASWITLTHSEAPAQATGVFPFHGPMISPFHPPGPHTEATGSLIQGPMDSVLT